MKTVLLIFFGIISLNWACSQKIPAFKFKIYISNALGYHDTLYLGLDPQAQKSVNLDFGDIDIRNIPYRKELDLRYDYDPNPIFNNPNFKKKVSWYNCNDSSVTTPSYFGHPTLTPICFTTNSFPVILKWDKNIFEDTCLDKTFICRENWSRKDYFELWQLFTPQVFMADEDSLVVTEELLKNTKLDFPDYPNQWKEISNDGSEVDLFMFFIGPTNKPLNVLLENDNLRQEDLISYVKISSNSLYINVNEELIYHIKSIDLFNLYGKILYSHINASSQVRIPIQEYAKGIYIVRILMDSGKFFNLKIFIN
ncbi:MAG: hypothetical protein JNL65_04780 [Saprospiraceae bacterium]|nr:hypothetical protein [Saprospiraceae bacterium]